MNLSALQTFLMIVETGSLIRTAEQLNVTQSTVTARLKTLEQTLGQTLIIRSKSGATLTASGLRLKRYAEVMTALWRQAQQETALPRGTEVVCNIGCHPDLWVGAGQFLFDRIRAGQGGVALSAWPGVTEELARWLDTGLIDIALTYLPAVRPGQSLHELPADRLILVSTRPDSPVRFDPGYVFVEAGDAFGRDHAAAYADADIARLSFGTADWGLKHILDQGGSAYLPERLVSGLLSDERLYRIADAPRFTRKCYLVVNDRVVEGWPWLGDEVSALVAEMGNG